jgi:hypothetical protein
MRRVLRCDGLLPVAMGKDGVRELVPEDIRAIRAWLSKGGARPDFDIIMEGETPAGDAAKASELVGPWAEASCTWWIESRWQMPHESPERMQRCVNAWLRGPHMSTVEEVEDSCQR